MTNYITMNHQRYVHFQVVRARVWLALGHAVHRSKEEC